MELYWWLVLANAKSVLETVSMISFLLSVFLMACYIAGSNGYLDDDDDKDTLKALLKFAALLSVTFICLLSISCFIPSRTDLAIMMGWDGIKSKTVSDVVDLIKSRI